MDKLVNDLKLCILFKGLTTHELKNLITNINYSIADNNKDCVESSTNIVALEGDICNSLGIVIQGEIEVQKHYASGKIVTLAKLNKGKIFGEAIAFSRNKYIPSYHCIKQRFNYTLYFKKMLYLCAVPIP